MPTAGSTTDSGYRLEVAMMPSSSARTCSGSLPSDCLARSDSSVSSEKLMPAFTPLLTAVRLQSFLVTVSPTNVAVIAGSALSAPSANATRRIAASVRAV